MRKKYQSSENKLNFPHVKAVNRFKPPPNVVRYDEMSKHLEKSGEFFDETRIKRERKKWTNKHVKGEVSLAITEFIS